VHSALNIGNGLGALLGGIAIAHGFGYLSPTWVGVGLSTIGFGLACLSFGLEARPAGRIMRRPLSRA